MKVVRNDGAFTLVELLVVMAIIGMLAAMLAVGLNMAKHMSRQTVCVNNLSQIGRALEMYLLEESEGYLPQVSGQNDNDDTRDWPDALKKYLDMGDWNDDVRVKNAADWSKSVTSRYRIFDCSSNRRPASDAPGNRFDYAYNTQLANSPTGGPWLAEKCGNVVVLHDQVHIAAPETSRVNECLGIHQGQDNFLFLGGWVKWNDTQGDASYGNTDVSEEPWDPTQ